MLLLVYFLIPFLQDAFKGKLQKILCFFTHRNSDGLRQY